MLAECWAALVGPQVTHEGKLGVKRLPLEFKDSGRTIGEKDMRCTVFTGAQCSI